MNTTLPSQPAQFSAQVADAIACESCGRQGQVTLDYPDTTFTLCVRCLPAELRARAVPLPGAADQVELELMLTGEPAEPVQGATSSAERALDEAGARA